jgi:hypothetical protein
MYSLVSAPVLGFDLARLQGGSAAADVLLRGLTLTSDDLAILAAAAPADDWQRLELWQDVDAAARQRQAVRDLSQGEEFELAGDLVGVMTVLERAPIGTLDGLLHCLRHDVLGWTWYDTATGQAQSETAGRATAVLCDALAAAYLRDLLPDNTRRRLAAGWLTAARDLPLRTIDLGPEHAAVTALLRRLRTARPADLDKLAKSAEATRRAAVDWAPAVHSASWAVYLADRVRAAAAAQLLLVQAVEDANIPVALRAAGVWNLLSGATQALIARDMLDGSTAARLVEPYTAALGRP